MFIVRASHRDRSMDRRACSIKPDNVLANIGMVEVHRIYVFMSSLLAALDMNI